MPHVIGPPTSEEPEEEDIGGEDCTEEEGDLVDGAVEERLGGATGVAEEGGDIDADNVEVVEVESEEPYSCICS